MTSLPPLKLNDGNAIIPIAYGLGTANFGQPQSELVQMAIKQAGYYHIDCAEMYQNSESVGAGWKATGVPREKLYLTTKLGGDDPRASIESELKALETSYIDLWLIHSNKTGQAIGYGKAWSIMEDLQKEGKAKSIGVSNYLIEQLEETLKNAKVVPAANQIEFHPYVYKEIKSTIDYCHDKGITIECYGPLTPLIRAKGGPLDPVVEKIAKETKLTEGQVLLKWAQQVSRGVIVTTSTKPERLAEQFAALQAPPLSDSQIEEITSVGSTHNHRAFAKMVILPTRSSL